jgi:acyl-CoA synthetase (AMP-forming)/AMP-acid ligase II
MTQLQTLGDLWDRNVRLYPDQEAVVYRNERRSYRELVTRARQLASGLHSLGAAPKDRISLLAKNRMEWFDYFAACELHGFTASTLNFRLAAEEIHFVLADAGASYLIFETEYAPIIEALRPRLAWVREYICIGDCPPWASAYDEVLALGNPGGPPFVATPGDPVRLIYTSGTTGKPKGVIRAQVADLALARACATTSDMPSGCRELIMMPLFHIGGQSMASGAHWTGGTVILQRDFNPADILGAIESERIQVLHVTPTILQAMLDHPDIDRRDLSSLETVIYAAAPMSVPLLKRGLRRLGNIFANCYGSTESGATIILQKRFHLADGSAEEIGRIGSLGQEHQDSRIRILDDSGDDCPPGSTGEIAVRCASMMSGYWNNPAATEAALPDGWLRTGDVGRMDSKGFVYLVDRKADMIISGGENIYSREVEQALQLHPAVKDAAVIGIPDKYWGETVKAIVVREAGASVTAEDLIEHCKAHIARYKAPRSVEFVGHLPQLPSAKIDKVTLRRQHGGADTIDSSARCQKQ